MEIQYLGHSCFRLKGKKTILVTDPFNPDIGLSMAKVTADIVTISHDHHDHNYYQAVEKTPRREPFIINGPGEYEVSEVFILGISTFHDSEKGKQRGLNTVYVVNIDGLRLAHLGDLGQRLTEEQIEEINGVDVLFIPVGGTYTIGPKRAIEVVNQIEPAIIIPMHYYLPSIKIKNLQPVEKFVKEIGLDSKLVSSLTISRESLPEEKEIYVFRNDKK